MACQLTPDFGRRCAAIALGHVGREYPNKLDHVLNGASDALTPRALHPIFYGSFDWHSCVHSYWMLARLERHSMAPGARDRFDEAFTEAAVAGELAYLQRSSAQTFERPYGWAWLLRLAAELERGQRPWAGTLRPLTLAFADRFKAFLPLADYPVRGGAHANSAFALLLAWDYARTVGDEPFMALIRDKAQAWYGADRAAPAWEPSGDDFLSPTLVEAQLMAAVMAPDAFRAWLAAYLPGLASGRPEALFTPARVSDRSDGKIAHLDGLNLSRAWSWRELAPHLAPDAAALARTTAERHLETSLPHVSGDYMGEHWLATYAVLALTA